MPGIQSNRVGKQLLIELGNQLSFRTIMHEADPLWIAGNICLWKRHQAGTIVSRLVDIGDSAFNRRVAVEKDRR